MYETKAHADENYLYFCLKGLMYRAEAEEAVAAIVAEGTKLKPGFTVINDISEARPSSPDIAEVIKKAQTALFSMGATKLIRVVANATKMQLARMQRESSAAYETHIATSLEDALDLL
jgi:hypothetical protein